MNQDSIASWSESFQKINSSVLNSTFQHSILTFEQAMQLTEICHGTSKSNEFEGVQITPQTAREIMIMRNLKLVRQIALSMRNTFQHVEIEDLFQSGIFGLMRAVEKWDPYREFQFSTYATWHIRQSISRFTLDNYYPIRIPIHMVDKLVRVKRYLIQYIDFFDCEPEDIEASDSLEMSLSEYLSCKEALFFYTSYEEEVTKDQQGIESFYFKTGISEVLTNPANVSEMHSLTEDLFAVMGTFSNREVGVIALRFGLADGRCRTLDEIGKVFGVTRERIRQIESKTMAKLRHPARSELLREYLDLADARYESIFAISKTHTSTEAESDWDYIEEEQQVFSPTLFCGGW